ncbi:TetR/AcrR family transcriptional regulator [Streptomyces triticagri]|uniref:TetR/AcrR family transcriptional regulator n=1 Tax=Streptomyces triticagri TaxID=2293568 RepID=A0A372MBE2_9ACTN|nr:TetR/AcrR family transcriptional regulator [Streptomyces triticagri]RFU88262.1 TetR/AcrR family transcriptional regulator [Streptomyces triticagri]
MGHREDLLEGAKRCLLDKGFVRTTARDIVKESGTNLASIGYHYGSKDKLLAEAYIALVEAVGDQWGADLFAGRGEAPVRSVERFHEVWARIVDSFPEARPIWMLSFESVLYGDRIPEVRKILVAAQRQGRAGLVPMFTGDIEDETDDAIVESEGRLYATLLNGLMLQWLLDPDEATDAEQLTAGLRRVIEGATGSPA